MHQSPKGLHVTRQGKKSLRLLAANAATDVASSLAAEWDWISQWDRANGECPRTDERRKAGHRNELEP